MPESVIFEVGIVLSDKFWGTEGAVVDIWAGVEEEVLEGNPGNLVLDSLQALI